MALFGDSPRFHSERNHCNLSNSFLKSSTPSHVGPGSSYDTVAEDVRSGWKPGRTSKHEPMNSRTNEGDMRGVTFVNATMTKDGYIVHSDRKKQNFPATGQYDPIKVTSPGKSNGEQRQSPRPHLGDETYMGTKAPRLSCCYLRHGVLVEGSPREFQRQRAVGPGSYFETDSLGMSSVDSMLKKSYNRRVSGGNEKGYLHSNPTTPRSRSNSTDRLRPKSADSSSGYFKRYTMNNLKNPPSPILRSPVHRVEQHNYEYSDGNGYRDISGSNLQNSPSTPFSVSPKRGIPIGRVYH